MREQLTELLTKLNQLADLNNIDRNNRYWPKTAHKLSYGLNLLQKTLRDAGISVKWYRDTSTRNNTRKIIVEFLPSEASDRPMGQNQARNEGIESDDRSDSDAKLPSDNELPSDERGQNRA